MTLYTPHSIFPFGAAFVCQAGNFWTLLRRHVSFCMEINPKINKEHCSQIKYYKHGDHAKLWSHQMYTDACSICVLVLHENT